MKEWIVYNSKLIVWIIALTTLCIGMLLFNGRTHKKDPEHAKVKKYCLELVSKFEGLELDPSEATFIPIGMRAKQASYSGISMVWEKETSGISVKCSIVSDGNRVKYFAVNGEDKTNIVGREERKK